MNTLTYPQIVDLVASLPGAVIMGLQTLTDSNAKKKGNPFGTIYKETRLVAIVGADYETAVNRELVRQGETKPDFDADKLPWGKWLVRSKIKEHKGNLYLRTQSAPGQRANQPAKVLAYRDEFGKILSREAVKPFLPVIAESNTQAEAGLDGVKNQIMVRDYGFKSLRKIFINHEVYEVEHPAKVVAYTYTPGAKPVIDVSTAVKQRFEITDVQAEADQWNQCPD